MTHSASIPAAVTYEKELAGTACRPHRIRFNDGHSYVVKFQGNPVGMQSLIGEYVAQRFAKAAGIPIADGGLVYVSKEFVAGHPQLHGLIAGIQFASRLVSDPPRHFDPTLLDQLSNRHQLAHMIAMDTLFCNLDRSGQNLLLVAETSNGHTGGWRFVIVDYSHCFEDQDYSSAAFAAVTNSLARYENVVTLRDACRSAAERDVAVQAIERVSDAAIGEIVISTPEEWGLRPEDANRMLEALIRRKGLIRRILNSARLHQRAEPHSKRKVL